MKKNGFSKIELLIVGAIIGVLGLSAVFAVQTARSRTRDAVRLSDIRQMQAGLELFFIDHNGYPESTEALALGGIGAQCLSENGFTSSCSSAYLKTIAPTPGAGLDGLSSCLDVRNAYCYVAQDMAYTISFELEHDNPLVNLQKGLNCATPSGIEAGPCPALTTSP